MAGGFRPTNQAILATATVLGFAFGAPLARQLAGFVPGLNLGPQAAGALGAALAFMIAKRVV